MKALESQPNIVRLHEVLVWTDKLTREVIQAIVMELCEDSLEKQIQSNHRALRKPSDTEIIQTFS
jgi:hypothetical protein